MNQSGLFLKPNPVASETEKSKTTSPRQDTSNGPLGEQIYTFTTLTAL